MNNAQRPLEVHKLKEILSKKAQKTNHELKIFLILFPLFFIFSLLYLFLGEQSQKILDILSFNI